MNPLIINDYINYNSPVIVALDYNNETDAMKFIAKLDSRLCKLKVGKELFTSAGPRFVEKLVASSYDVFLDLKFHDIPNTVHKACMAAANLGVWMINVHASGGQKMLEAAVNGVASAQHKPLLIAVTVLTSMSENELQQIGVNDSIDKQVERLAKLGFQCGLDGVVCSAWESRMIKDYTSNKFLTVTPGIRLSTSITDDQTRVMTPEQAIKNSSDYLVIGRPITQAQDPQAALINIISQINRLK